MSNTLKSSPISPTIPFDQDGVHHGHLQLPYSRDDSAWGSVMVPITVIRNGAGPTALLTGANHGDEYEGVIALLDLAATLSPDAVRSDTMRGRIIILPALNYPAFRAGTRTSPIDRGNMNRIFPGKPDGTVTQQIADYVQRVLIPMADAALDMHSGGKTLDFLPLAAAHLLEDKTQEAACIAAMQAFCAPYSLKMLEMDAVGMLDTAVEDAGKLFVTTELGGGGTSTARSNAIAKRGLRNFLIHIGVLRGQIEHASSTLLNMPDDQCFHKSLDSGLLEPMADLGDGVLAGDLLARVWPVDRTGVQPVLYHAQRDGIVMARHFPGLIGVGDCLAVVAEIVP